MSVSGFWRNTHMCVDTLFEDFTINNIRLPTRAEAEREAQRYHQISNFPPIGWGAVDGCHIAICPSAADRLVYINRKGWPSLNCMFNAGASFRIWTLKTNSPGKL